ncbi:MAG: TIGR01777 family oxidoreductase [Candidatus Methylumidiphilus sp.]
MDILITGGTCSIGRVLCRTLKEKGHGLTVLSRRPEKVKAICGEGIAALSSLADLPASARFDAVINLAGEAVIGPYWTATRKKILWDSRVTLTEQLVDFISRAEIKPQVLINTSAVGFYGNGGDDVIDEDSPGAGGFAHTLCDGWEKAASRVEEYGVRLCIVRFGLVLMSHGGMLKSMLPSFRFGLGARIGDGRQWMPWIHCADLIAMIELLLENPELSGVFNGVSPNPVTNREFTAGLAKALNRPAFFFVPAFLLKAAMGEMGLLLLEGQRAIPKRLQKAGFEFRYPDLDHALTDIIG